MQEHADEYSSRLGQFEAIGNVAGEVVEVAAGKEGSTGQAFTRAWMPRLFAGISVVIGAAGLAVMVETSVVVKSVTTS